MNESMPILLNFVSKHGSLGLKDLVNNTRELNKTVAIASIVMFAVFLGMGTTTPTFAATYPYQPNIQTNAIKHISNGITVNCGDIITTSVKLKHNIVCTGLSDDGIDIAGNNIVLDCGGHTITGTGAGLFTSVGIRSSLNTGVTIKNCEVNGFDGDIVIIEDAFDHLKNNKAINSNNNGIVSVGGESNLIESNLDKKSLGLGTDPISGDGFFEESIGDILVNNKSIQNAGYGFGDVTSGFGTGGTTNGYFENGCDKNTLGTSNPFGLCN